MRTGEPINTLIINHSEFEVLLRYYLENRFSTTGIQDKNRDVNKVLQPNQVR